MGEMATPADKPKSSKKAKLNKKLDLAMLLTDAEESGKIPAKGKAKSKPKSARLNTGELASVSTSKSAASSPLVQALSAKSAKPRFNTPNMEELMALVNPASKIPLELIGNSKTTPASTTPSLTTSSPLGKPLDTPLPQPSQPELSAKSSLKQSILEAFSQRPIKNPKAPIETFGRPSNAANAFNQGSSTPPPQASPQRGVSLSNVQSAIGPVAPGRASLGSDWSEGLSNGSLIGRPPIANSTPKGGFSGGPVSTQASLPSLSGMPVTPSMMEFSPSQVALAGAQTIPPTSGTPELDLNQRPPVMAPPARVAKPRGGGVMPIPQGGIANNDPPVIPRNLSGIGDELSLPSMAKSQPLSLPSMNAKSGLSLPPIDSKLSLPPMNETSNLSLPPMSVAKQTPIQPKMSPTSRAGGLIGVGVGLAGLGHAAYLNRNQDAAAAYDRSRQESAIAEQSAFDSPIGDLIGAGSAALMRDSDMAGRMLKLQGQTPRALGDEFNISDPTALQKIPGSKSNIESGGQLGPFYGKDPSDLGDVGLLAGSGFTPSPNSNLYKLGSNFNPTTGANPNLPKVEQKKLSKNALIRALLGTPKGAATDGLAVGKDDLENY